MINHFYDSAIFARSGSGATQAALCVSLTESESQEARRVQSAPRSICAPPALFLSFRECNESARRSFPIVSAFVHRADGVEDVHGETSANRHRNHRSFVSRRFLVSWKFTRFSQLRSFLRREIIRKERENERAVRITAASRLFIFSRALDTVFSESEAFERLLLRFFI